MKRFLLIIPFAALIGCSAEDYDYFWNGDRSAQGSPTGYNNNSYQPSGGYSSGYTQQTTDRYNSAVKSAADKERQRVQDLQWNR